KAKADKEAHEKEAIELFESIGLKEEDINELDIYEHSIPELEEKAYAILGKKLAEKKQEISVDKEETKKTKRDDLSQASKEKKTKKKKKNEKNLSKERKKKKTSKYGNLFDKYSK